MRSYQFAIILSTVIFANAHVAIAHAGESSLTFNQLATTIQSHNIRSVEELFQQVGAAPFNLMAIVQDSTSLQDTVAPSATSALVPLLRRRHFCEILHHDVALLFESELLQRLQ